MKVAILAGGTGSRLAPDNHGIPKPLTPIGGRPVLGHVLHLYARQGFRDFVLALGHRADEVGRYAEQLADEEGWTLRAVNTGPGTGSAGRILRLEPWLGDAPFMLTWCDGLADIDLHALLDFHRRHGRLATVTAVHPPERFGCLQLDGSRVTAFDEKPVPLDRWVNGAFFVLQPEVLRRIGTEEEAWEEGPMPRLVAEDQLRAYRHDSFWHCLDTAADRQVLDTLWSGGAAPWAAPAGAHR